MPPDKLRYHAALASYFSSQPHFFDSDLQKKPHIRKCMELPYQQTKSEMWDDVTNTLCDLDFIQAKACAKMTYDLVKDFNTVLQVIPDNAENIREENQRQARMDKYTRDLIAYAKGEIKELEIPENVTPWSEDKINAEIERIRTTTNRLDRLNDFLHFLGQEAGNLHNYAMEFPHFTFQQAWNWADSGPVGKDAEKEKDHPYKSLLLRPLSNRPSWNPLPKSILTLKGHTDNVITIAITPDGKKAFSGSADDTCIFWDMTTGQAIHVLHDHKNVVNSVAITPDGTRAISASNDGTCILWDLKAGQATCTLKEQRGRIWKVALTHDGKRALSSTYDSFYYPEKNTFILWDLDTGQSIYTLKGHTQYITDFVISHDGKRAFTGAGDNNCIFWNLEKGLAILILKEHIKPIAHVAIANDCNKAASVSHDKTIIIWDLMTGNKIQVLSGFKISVKSLSFTPDSKNLEAFFIDNTSIEWDVITGHVINKSIQYRINLRNNFIIPDGAFITITSDGTKAISKSGHNFVVWDLMTWNSENANNVHDQEVTSLEVTTDGRKAISASRDHTCIVWNTEDGKVIHTLKGHTDQVISITLTPDGKNALSGSLDKSCIIWDLTTGQLINRVTIHKSSVASIFVTPDNQRIISIASDKTSFLWDIKTGNILQTIRPGIRRLVFIAGGRKAVLSREDNRCVLWDLVAGKPLNTLNGLTRTLATTPDGMITLTDFTFSSKDKCASNNAIVWNHNTGYSIHTLDIHTNWYINPNQEIFELKGHTNAITSIAVTPDGKKVITGSDDHKCILWDLRKREIIHIFNGLSSVKDVIITTDGTNAIVSYSDDSCYIWNIENGEKEGVYVSSSTLNIIKYFSGSIVGIDKSGKIFIINNHEKLLQLNKSIVTICQIWNFVSEQYMSPTADCPLCGHRFEPSASVLETIDVITKKASLKPDKSPCLELPDEAWEEPGLLGNCPKCRGELKFNPFIADNKAEKKDEKNQIILKNEFEKPIEKKIKPEQNPDILNLERRIEWEKTNNRIVCPKCKGFNVVDFKNSRKKVGDLIKLIVLDVIALLLLLLSFWWLILLIPLILLTIFMFYGFIFYRVCNDCGEIVQISKPNKNL